MDDPVNRGVVVLNHGLQVFDLDARGEGDQQRADDRHVQCEVPEAYAVLVDVEAAVRVSEGRQPHLTFPLCARRA